MKGDQEPDLPVTPTNEGRRPRISNFGYNVAYPDLWPLLVGLGGSMLVVLAWTFGVLRFHWSVVTILAGIPAIAAHFYIKLFVEDALPHTQQDTFARLVSLEPVFSDPVLPRWPLLPKFRPALTMAAQAGDDDGLHPLLSLREKFNQVGQQRRKRR